MRFAAGLATGALRSSCTRSLQSLVPGPGGERCAYTTPLTAGACCWSCRYLARRAGTPFLSCSFRTHDHAICMARHQAASMDRTGLVACFELLVVDELLYDASIGRRLAGSVDHVDRERNELNVH